MCIKTRGCTAFQFDKKSGKCYLGSKLNLIMSQPSNSQDQLTQINTKSDGKHTLNNNTYTRRGIRLCCKYREVLKPQPRLLFAFPFIVSLNLLTHAAKVDFGVNY